MKRFAVLATAVAATAGVMIPAQAATAQQFIGEKAFIRSACPGSQIDSGRLKDNQNRTHPTAVWRLYYSPNQGGTNCLSVWDNKSGKHYMGAVIQRTGRQVHSATDFGTYEYYAGAVGIYDMNGRCVDWSARIDDGGRMYGASQFNSHCG